MSVKSVISGAVSLQDQPERRHKETEKLSNSEIAELLRSGDPSKVRRAQHYILHDPRFKEGSSLGEDRASRVSTSVQDHTDVGDFFWP